jgi:hypothetical protein
MPMSLGGRSRVWQPITVQEGTAVRGAIVEAPDLVVRYCETFPNDGIFDLTVEDLTWQIPSTGAGIITGGVLYTTGGFADGRAEQDAGSADMFVQAALNADVDYIYLVARCGDTGDLYGDQGIYLFVDPGGGVTFIDLGDWTGGSVASDSPAGNLIDGTWRLEVEGGTARALRNGIEMLTGDISAITAPTGQRGGFNMGSNAVGMTYPGGMDNFCVGLL